jgi:signal transduction histidine kinase
MTNKLSQYKAQAEELLRNISHELRSPLSRMLVSLDIVQQRDTSEKIEHVRIKKEINLLNKLIGSILEYSIVGNVKKESDKLINLTMLAKEVIENINFEYKNIKTHNIEVNLEAEPNINFFGYESQLKSALENILRNAMKYGPKNSRILFKISKKEQAIDISITDEGAGVNQSDAEKIFEPFHRTFQANIENEEGSGLGLAIAKEAVELNKGRIKAITTDKDFTVKITLPKKKIK